MVEFVIENAPILSVNQQYFSRIIKGKIRRVRTKELVSLQKFYDKEFKEKITDDDIKEFMSFIESDKKNNGLSLMIEFGFQRKNMRRSDVSNYVKSIEDCISNRLGIDDRHNLRVSSYKSISPNDNKWIRIKIDTYTLSNFNE